ncbi:WGR domain-containing protein [Methylocystis sp. IM3]|uniref:WGR domain-containing protein n=1 Tax=unclassified Methylocystis TaxID=2625913 RepID=UPI0030F523E4
MLRSRADRGELCRLKSREGSNVASSQQLVRHLIGMSSTHDLSQQPGLAILLHRIAPARNMRRFYRINILSDLFGSVPLMKQWESIGSTRQSQVWRFEEAATAHAALFAHARHKERRGCAAPAE